MRILGFSVPLIILLIGAYIIGAKYPGLFNKAKAAVPGA
jgi:phosphomevalonate kinase